MIAPRLTERSDVAGALIERPIVTADAIAGEDDFGSSAVQRFQARLPRTGKWRYKGRTVMLIDERAVSQAEHTGLYFKAANGTLAGGKSDRRRQWRCHAIPGSRQHPVGFSGQAIKHPDGRQLQRVGLIPDVEVRPTIAGMRAGRDEVLEKAVEIIRSDCSAERMSDRQVAGTLYTGKAAARASILGRSEHNQTTANLSGRTS